MSLRFALLMIVAIALWHRAGISSSFCVSVRCRTFVARDGVGLVSGCGLGSGGDGDVGRFCCGVLCRCRLAQLFEAFDLPIICVREWGVNFTGVGLGVWLCHWPNVLGEFVVCA